MFQRQTMVSANSHDPAPASLGGHWGTHRDSTGASRRLPLSACPSCSRAHSKARLLRRSSISADGSLAYVLLDPKVEDVDVGATAGDVKDFSVIPLAVDFDLNDFADNHCLVPSRLLSLDAVYSHRWELSRGCFMAGDHPVKWRAA